jgi:hypothetical protein
MFKIRVFCLPAAKSAAALLDFFFLCPKVAVWTLVDQDSTEWMLEPPPTQPTTLATQPLHHPRIRHAL